ncbi:hypothetical protein Zmor_005569 [Zophobas morio]|uniref:Sushi domain-containing protein n=1 Tax=Zophobas morio TaxID=2755281 RepID=A0AA38ITL2_9CUCU|nr:hypothetical protein Zmor_005569 [Zophobas morio]
MMGKAGNDYEILHMNKKNFVVKGKWSAPVPTCELVKCESLATPGGLYEPHLQLEEHNNSYGGRAVFSCAWGYRLMGPPGIECELNGNWSGPLPKCVPIQCPPPIIPVNGHLIQSEAAGMDGGRYAVGSSAVRVSRCPST